MRLDSLPHLEKKSNQRRTCLWAIISEAIVDMRNVFVESVAFSLVKVVLVAGVVLFVMIRWA